MTRQAWIVFVAVAAVAATLGVTACIISYDPDAVELSEQSTAARVNVLTPEPDTQVAEFLEVHLRVENLTLVPNWGEANVEGEAHLAVFIDGHAVAAPGEGIALSDFAIGVAGLGASSQSTHTLRIEVLNNDRTPYADIHTMEVSWIKLPIVAGPPTPPDGTGNGTGDGTGAPAE